MLPIPQQSLKELGTDLLTFLNPTVLHMMHGAEAKEMRCPTGDSDITLQAKAESILSDDPGLRMGTSMTLR
jgi:hypothetical protein